MLILILTGLSLLTALWAGLVRLGWKLPPLLFAVPVEHGPLMVSGFLGTLICLERAVALGRQPEGRKIYYVAPLLSGLSALALILGLPPLLARGLGVLGAVALVLIFAHILRIQPSVDHAIMGLGAILWLTGNVLWLNGVPLYKVAPWWVGFLVVTIAGERLELARIFTLGREARTLLVVAIGLLIIGLAVSLPSLASGMRMAGLALVALGLWLLRFDIARRTIRQTGLTRYIAACLLPGYLWLILGGGLWLVFGGQYVAGPVYDAMLHSLLLGFVFSMIFGHAPIILPAILGTAVPYHPFFYGHLALLHLSLLLRVASDLARWPAGRQWGGLLNEVAVVLFLLVTMIATRRAQTTAVSGAPSHRQ